MPKYHTYWKAELKTFHTSQPHSAPLEGRTVDSGKSKTNNTIARRSSLSFIILSTLMMLLLNKNSPSSRKDIRQSLWLCIRGPSCHQQACSSGGMLPGEGAETAVTEYMQREINSCNLLRCLRKQVILLN